MRDRVEARETTVAFLEKGDSGELGSSASRERITVQPEHGVSASNPPG